MNVQVCMPLLSIVSNHRPLGITKSWVSWDHGWQPKGERCRSRWGAEGGLSCLWEPSVPGCGGGYCWGKPHRYFLCPTTAPSSGAIFYLVTMAVDHFANQQDQNARRHPSMLIEQFAISNLSSQLGSVKPEPSLTSLNPLAQDLLGTTESTHSVDWLKEN